MPGEIAIREQQQGVEVVVSVINPMTGELVPVTAPLDDLAGWLSDVRDYEGQVRHAKNVITGIMHTEHLDPTGQWTAHTERFKVTGQSPEPETDYDGERLHKVLLKLVKQGRITREAAARACEREVSFKPKKTGIKALSKIGSDVAEAIEACATEKPREQRRISLSLKPNGGAS
jgi:hypothetical protein